MLWSLGLSNCPVVGHTSTDIYNWENAVRINLRDPIDDNSEKISTKPGFG